MPLIRFEECRALLTESLSWTYLKPQHSIPNLTLYPINSGVMTSLLLPHLSSSLTDSLSSWISYATQKLMLDSCKMVEKQSEAFIRFCGIFSKFKKEFYYISFSHVQMSFFKFTSGENQALVGYIPIPAVFVHFEPEILNIGQSSHKMYSNEILNFQVSTTILNGSKESLETYWKHHVPIYIYIYINHKL